MKTCQSLSLGCALLGFLIFSDIAEAGPVRLITDLASITFWERTGGVAPTPSTFGVNSTQLTTRLSDPLSTLNRDIAGAGTEFYDVFYSDADGTFNLDGEYLTIEGVYRATLPAGGGLNLAEIGLNFAATPTEFGNFVASFSALGDNAIPGSVGNAIDGDLQTHTTMGNTVGQTQRLRVTLGFFSSSGPAPVPEPSALLLLASGVLILIGLGRRFSKKILGQKHWRGDEAVKCVAARPRARACAGSLIRKTVAVCASAATLFLASGSLQAGPVFLTGHDPDFHSQPGFGSGGTLFRAGLSYVTNGTYSDLNPLTEKFLWVESRIAPPGGHLTGENGLASIGLTLGTHYDRANAVELATVNFSNYSAIAIASSFGGLLTRAELDTLIARSADIASFINGGGGLFASSECYPCGANLLAGMTAPDLFGYLPVDVTSIGANPPFTVTAFGAAAPFNLANGNVNDPTHNSFGLVGGLNVVDTDSSGHATTLAGNVTVGTTGFTPAPEPVSLALLGIGLAGMSWARRRRV